MPEMIDVTRVPVSIAEKSANRHDLAAWSDGSITIQHYLYQDEQDNHLSHCRLNANEARALRNFLNSQAVMKTLISVGTGQSTTIPIDAREVARKIANNHDISAWTDGSITIDHCHYVYLGDESAGHCRLNMNEARAMRNFLNSEAVKKVLGLV